jgi:hypothetical protein
MDIYWSDHLKRPVEAADGQLISRLSMICGCWMSQSSKILGPIMWITHKYSRHSWAIGINFHQPYCKPKFFILHKMMFPFKGDKSPLDVVGRLASWAGHNGYYIRGMCVSALQHGGHHPRCTMHNKNLTRTMTRWTSTMTTFLQPTMLATFLYLCLYPLNTGLLMNVRNSTQLILVLFLWRRIVKMHPPMLIQSIGDLDN